jgi:hypothetical protein
MHRVTVAQAGEARAPALLLMDCIRYGAASCHATVRKSFNPIIDRLVSGAA